MTEKLENDSIYTPEREMLDSIREVYSSVNPTEQRLVSILSSMVKDEILEKFGEHISENKKEMLKKVSEHIVVVDEEGFEKIMEDWTLTPSLPGYSKNFEGRYTHIGELIVLRDEKDVIKSASDIAYSEKLLSPGMPRDVFEKRLMMCLLTEVMVHEITHYSQNPTTDKNNREALISVAFSECGASYATDAIMFEKFPNVTKFDRPYNIERKEKFEQLLKKYGDDTWDVFFGKYESKSPEGRKMNDLRKNILNEYDLHELARLGII